MPLPTFEFIAYSNLNGSVAEFANIPQTYTDLRIYTSQTNIFSSAAQLYVNDATGVYGGAAREVTWTPELRVYNPGETRWDLRSMAEGATYAPGIAMFDFYNYTDTTKPKTVLGKIASNQGYSSWMGTYTVSGNAITKIIFYKNTGNWSDGSFAAIYGIKKD